MLHFFCLSPGLGNIAKSQKYFNGTHTYVKKKEKIT